MLKSIEAQLYPEFREARVSFGLFKLKLISNGQKQAKTRINLGLKCTSNSKEKMLESIQSILWRKSKRNGNLKREKWIGTAWKMKKWEDQPKKPLSL